MGLRRRARHHGAVLSGRLPYHDVAVMNEPINQRRGHDIIAEDVAPVFKALLEVRMVDADSSRRLRSWKNSIAPVRVIGR